MNETRKHAGTLELRGERLCLNFANTVGWHASDHPQEWLHSYRDLLAWSWHAGTLTNDQHERLLQKARDHPNMAEGILAQALVLREAIYRIFSYLVQGYPAEIEDLTILQRAYAEAMLHMRLVPLTDRFTFTWQENEDVLAMPLWPLAHSGIEVLCSKECHQVKECPGDGCGWLFLDRSRNQSRRWCNGQDCGNRVRVRQHYQRHRTTRIG